MQPVKEHTILVAYGTASIYAETQAPIDSHRLDGIP